MCSVPLASGSSDMTIIKMMIWKEKENFKEKTGIDTLFSHRRATPPGTDTPEVGSQQGREVREREVHRNQL